jgi:UDP-4-amino-4,6-dideoxy-N-acetyl-beta-L-altrosamine transaminase
MIPYGRQDVTQADIDAVTAVLRSDFLTQGPMVPRFEQAVAQLVKARHAVAVNSATSALHLACMALGLKAGERLWTVPNTFVASANCARYCGADVDFVDIDPLTWNLSTERLEEKLKLARRSNCLPQVLVPVHFSGQPTEQERVWELAQEYGFKILEDASHAIGASRHAEPVGSCRWSDVTVFSFHPVKIVTSAEGGMALSNDAGLSRSIALLRSHGITRDATQWTHADGRDAADPSPPGAWYYEQQELGYNYRLTDVHAALGISQVQRVGAYVRRRNELAQRYTGALRGLALQLPHVAAGNYSAFHLYVVRLRDGGPQRHRELFQALRARGIGVNLHYSPVHLHPYYRRLGFSPGQFPEAEAYATSALTLPLYAAMSEAQQDEVVAVLRQLL